MSTVNSLTTGIFNMFKGDAGVQANSFYVQLGGVMNTDPDYTPWVGVYRGPFVQDPRLLGGAGIGNAGQWMTEIDIYIFHQEYSQQISSGDVFTRLDTAADSLRFLLRGNITVSGAALAMLHLTSELYHQNRDKDNVFLTNLITCKYELLE